MRLSEFTTNKSYIAETIIGYHGSSESSPVFARTHTGHNSHTFGAYDSNRTGAFFTDNPEFAAMYGVVGKYRLLVKNTCIDCLEQAYDFSETLDAFSPAERSLWLDIRRIRTTGKVWQLFENDIGEAFVRWLIEQGFDSAQFDDWTDEDEDGVEHDSVTTVVFDPTNITRINQ
jgi:hypothetical protein